MDQAPQPVPTLSGPALYSAFVTAASWLDRHEDAINALNVFPVPDGDTGLNLSLTLRSAVAAVTDANAVAATIAANLARGALLGARGNSGVILAQYLRAWASSLQGLSEISPPALATALDDAAAAAYTAVQAPQEGTMLSVARAIAAGGAAATNSDMIALLQAVHEAAQRAVADTPNQLAILRQAGVVDSGGEGLRVIFEGLLRALRGDAVPSGPVATTTRADLSQIHALAGDESGYCTEVLFRAPEVDQGAVRAALSELGTSVLVVADDGLVKVHVHTERPGAVLNLATDLGAMVQVKVDNLADQVRAFAQPSTPSHQTQEGTTLVAVTAGAGFARLFTGLGATVVASTEAFNPSVAELLAAIASAPRADVLLVTNNPNVVLAAEQAIAATAHRRVRLLSTSSMPQGLAVALALAPWDDLDANYEHAQRAAAACTVVQVARAARDAIIGTLEVRHGAYFATLDGEPIATTTTLHDVLEHTRQHLPRSTFEIATVYVGNDGSQDEGQGIADWLEISGVAAEVVVEHGDQPHYAYAIGLE